MKNNGKIRALKTDNLGLGFQLSYQVVLCPGIIYLMFQVLLSLHLGGHEHSICLKGICREAGMA